MRLSKDDIRDIITAHLAEESHASIARRKGCDRSTVAYHIQLFDDAYKGGRSIYSIMKTEVQHQCVHPSFVCLLCKVHRDAIMRADRIRILQLEAEIRRLKGE
jgi:hypothetical protein